jgi:hypothetical protein
MADQGLRGDVVLIWMLRKHAVNPKAATGPPAATSDPICGSPCLCRLVLVPATHHRAGLVPEELDEFERLVQPVGRR